MCSHEAKIATNDRICFAHLRETQKRQKMWYDRKTKSRSFELDQKVLVMIPTSENKLLGKWQGPFEVIKKIGTTTITSGVAH